MNSSLKSLRLAGVSYRCGRDPWLHPLNLSLAPGEFNVLLGATRAGKTTLLRLMAGLDRPTTGRLYVGDCDVTDTPVRKRNVAMVYQQFINYPSLSVYENIASPLRLARVRETEIRKRVDEIAETLGLTALLARRPSELSGGQQQRTALARALAKQADLVLLDEPLANLDYKLREGLREELVRLFAQRGTTVVYATTEPQEALQLGGRSIILVEGRLVQQGPALEVFRRPTTLEAARTFSDPPLNCIPARIAGSHLTAALAGGTQLSLPPHAAGSLRGGPQEIVLAVRAHHVSTTPKSSTSGAIRGRVDLAEISGSDTYLHVAHENLTIVAQIPGVHTFTLGSACTVYIDPIDLYGFNADGTLSFAPEPTLGSH